MEGFSWWWIIYGCVALFFGVCVGLIMLIAMYRKGSIALFMVPLVVWQFLWASWGRVRSDWLVDWWFNQNGYSSVGYEAIYLIQALLFWTCILLALVPALAKDKPASNPATDTN